MSEGRAVAQPSLATRWTSDAATFGIVIAATAAVWGHTIDEIRIGEMSAIPAGILNLALVSRWRGLGLRSRGWLSLLFGLFWTITVIPYHVVPLLQGVTTWQNVSGLLRVVGGIAMVGAGAVVLRARSGQDSSATRAGSGRVGE
jgi:hypothetical protein